MPRSYSPSLLPKLGMLLPLALAVFSAEAQTTRTLRGYLEDADAGERLIGATVFDVGAGLGTTSNNFGYFSYTYRGDTLRIRVAYVGLANLDTVIVGPPPSELTLRLRSSAELATVEVRAANAAERIDERVQMSAIDVPIEQIKRAPQLLGEADVLKALQFLPGVSGGSEGTAGLYVRGGSPDQNLILLDGVPVYNVSHVLGIFSVFNADAINSVSLVKGGFPARYGGRLSSVIEINMKDGNADKWHGEGGIGIISSRLTLNGPVDQKTRVLVSGRRTYADLLAKPFIAAANKRNQSSGSDYSYKTNLALNFFDLNAKIRHELAPGHTLYLSGYLGGDVFNIKESSENSARNSEDSYGGGVNWGNKIAAARWNFELGPRLFLNTTATFSDYTIDFESEFYERDGTEEETYLARYRSGIRDFGLRSDLSFIPNPNHYLRTGFNVTHHTYSPGALSSKFTTGTENTSLALGSAKEEAVEFAAYVEDEWRLSPKLAVNAGLHASAFSNDTVYASLQPRIAARYVLPKGYGLKASYARMTQFINLLTSEALSLPTDLWVPSNERILPQRSWQAAVGGAKEFDGGYEVSAEAFYKSMSNVVSYRPGGSFFNFQLDESWEDKIVQGTGEVYGLELLAQKKLGRTTGWLGYTLSWNNRTFAGINGGKPFPFRYDRRHDFSALISYEINERITFTGAWIFATGNAITIPEFQQAGNISRQSYTGTDPNTGQPAEQVYFNYQTSGQGEGKNQYRLSNTHRLDFSFEFRKAKRWGERAWVVGAYNAYSHKNPFFLLATNRYNQRTQRSERVFQEISILPIVPSVSYKFKF